jgi:SAM-dependent methyltransferase
MTKKTSFLSHSLFPHHFPKDGDGEFGVSAARDDLLHESDLQMPQAEEDGKIPTFNQTGFMTPDQNPYNLDFIDFAANCQHPVLDIGVAYGITSLPTLQRGAVVIANDIDERHLLLLREQAPKELRGRLFLNRKRFPNETEFKENSLGAILVCRIAHFLTGDEMEKAIIKMAKWIIPGGRIYVVTMSPYHHLLKNIFFPIYLKKANENVPWPGEINNIHEYAPHLTTKIPRLLHVMDSHSLGRAFLRNGLNILKEGFFDYIRPVMTSSGGKGYYGITVEKK